MSKAYDACNGQKEKGLAYNPNPKHGLIKLEGYVSHYSGQKLWLGGDADTIARVKQFTSEKKTRAVDFYKARHYAEVEKDMNENKKNGVDVNHNSEKKICYAEPIRHSKYVVHFHEHTKILNVLGATISLSATKKKLVNVWVSVKSYAFKSSFPHNKGDTVIGWKLTAQKIKVIR